MNGRIHADETAEGRIAAVAKSLCCQMREKHKRDPDYADFRDCLRPFVQRELIRAKIEEARSDGGRAITSRVRQLAEELEAIKCPDVFNLDGR